MFSIFFYILYIRAPLLWTTFKVYHTLECFVSKIRGNSIEKTVPFSHLDTVL